MNFRCQTLVDTNNICDSICCDFSSFRLILTDAKASILVELSENRGGRDPMLLKLVDSSVQIDLLQTKIQKNNIPREKLNMLMMRKNVSAELCG